jgi:hypothetical protein
MNRSKSRLKSNERAALREMGRDVLALRYDWHRRLRNALLALAMMDPGWMAWAEADIDEQRMSVQAITRLVEGRAGACVLKHHQWLGRARAGALLFDNGFMFNDRGDMMQV